MLKIQKNLVTTNKYSIKCPYAMKPTRIVIHNTANDASAENEIKYMISNNKKTSFHFAVDDISIIQGVPLDRNAWHAGDGSGKGNREGIGIEICYSKSGGQKWLKAVENAADLTVYLLKQYGWDITKVTKHQDYSGKHCPHRILDEYGWDNFIALIKKKLSGDTPKPTEKISVIYQTHDDVKNKWLDNVKDKTDYAGNFKNAIDGVLANLTKGNIWYKVHTIGTRLRKGKWLPEVKNREDFAGNFNQPIDAVMFKTDTGKKIRYRVHEKLSGRWLDAVTGYNEKDSKNGYAGNFGNEIDAIQIWIE